MPTLPRLLIATGAALGVCGVGLAQNPQPLEQGTADISPLQTSLRVLPQVMRHDMAFDHVYSSPLDPNQRYRVAGGVYALFDQSQYASTESGPVAVYPAGVEFHIGPPLGFAGNPVTDPATAALLRYTDPRSIPNLDLSALDRQPARARRLEAQAGPPGVATLDPTISSEPVRQRRLREITARAIREAGTGG